MVSAFPMAAREEEGSGLRAPEEEGGEDAGRDPEEPDCPARVLWFA